MSLKTIRRALLCALILGIAVLSTVPVSAGPPFVEYQDVPIYVSGEGWCTLRTVYTYDGDGGFERYSFIIC